MRRADARSRENNRPAGVTFCFQVRENSIEPSVSNRCFNLLPKNALRFALSDEPESDRPQVTLVFAPFTFSGRTERLTGETGAPNRSACRPACKLEREIPSGNPSEKSNPLVSPQILSPHITDASIIHHPFRDQPVRYQPFQPPHRSRIVVIVIIHSNPFTED